MKFPGRSAYFPLYLFLTPLLLLIPVLLLVEKGQVFLWFNSLHTPFLDTFFKYYTHLGDGLMFVWLTLGLLFVRYRFALASLLVGALHGVLVNIFKRVVFKGTPRPNLYFGEQGIEFHKIDGVDLHNLNAFPSGHTATGFAFALLCAFMLPRHWQAVLLFIGAVLVGVSRIWIGQHFFEDTVFGAILGIFSAYVIWRIFNKRFFRESEKWNGSLISLFRGKKSGTANN